MQEFYLNVLATPPKQEANKLATILDAGAARVRRNLVCFLTRAADVLPRLCNGACFNVFSNRAKLGFKVCCHAMLVRPWQCSSSDPSPVNCIPRGMPKWA